MRLICKQLSFLIQTSKLRFLPIWLQPLLGNPGIFHMEVYSCPCETLHREASQSFYLLCSLTPKREAEQANLEEVIIHSLNSI